MSNPAARMLRSALPRDIPALQRLINHFAAEDEMLPRTLSEMYENLRDFILCEADGEVIGCVGLHLIWSDLAEIKSLAVAESAQGLGIGTELVRAAMAEARRFGIPRVFALTYRPGFFERLGFRQIDKQELPQKIWGECIRCHKFPNCAEQAVLFEMHEA